MENYCPKCGSRITFNEKNNKYTCSNCGHSFYEKEVYINRKKVNEGYYNKKTPLEPNKSYVGLIFAVLGISIALFCVLTTITRYTFYKDFKVKMTGETVSITELKNKTKEKLVIPSSVVKIGYNAMEDSMARSITIEYGLRTIEDYAFKNCKNLVDITIPRSVKYIGQNSFFGNDRLKDVYYDGTIEDWCNIYFYAPREHKGCAKYDIADNFGDASPMDPASNFYILDKNGNVEHNNKKYSLLTELTIPKSVYTLGDHQFSGFDCITQVTIPENVSIIKNSTFYGCTNLKKVNIEGKLTHIPINTFRNCTSLEEVVLSDSITYMDRCAFYDCSSLVKLNFDHIIAIYNKAFHNAGFKSLEFSDKEMHIDSRAFEECKKLVSLHIGYGVKDISYYAFSNCSNLYHVSIPTTIENIEEMAFYNCGLLTQIEYRGTIDYFRYYVHLKQDWNKNTLINNIKCSDGDYSVTLNNVTN